MKKFLKDPLKISIISLIATIVITVLLITLLQFASVEFSVFRSFARVFIAITLPFLIVNPLFGFIYSFFIKGKKKFIYIILHLACVCTISLFALVSFMFRYFVSFAP